MPADTYLCQCQYRSCCSATDARTGVSGRYLGSMDFKRHQRDDVEWQRKMLRERANEAQHAILLDQLNRMTIATPQPGPHEDAKYKADRKRSLISNLVQWQERSEELLGELQNLGDPSSTHQYTLSELRHAVSALEAICKSHGEIAINLGTITKAKLAKEQSVNAVLVEVQTQFMYLTQKIKATQLLWDSVTRETHERIELEDAQCFDSSTYFNNILENSPAVVQLASLMVLVCNVILRLPRRGCHWLLSMCSYIVETAFYEAIATSTIKCSLATIIRDFPKDIRSVTANLKIERESTIYAVCPRCHETYKPLEDSGQSISYPQRCNSSRYSNRCGELLLRPKSTSGVQVFIPIKPYIVFDMHSWLASLMSRNGYEELMDSAWDRMNYPGEMDDIFQGSIIRNFKGPDGSVHFSKSGPEESTGRYLLSMGFDFFNPLRVLANGKKVSVGIIAFTCLNLPIQIRHRPENVFLAAIIPGPKEPRLDAMNPYLRPLMEVLVQLWTGVRFTQTSLHNNGRWVMCALIAVVCDLQAARKIAGLSPGSHEYFCSICWCNRTQHTYNDWNYRSWTRRTSASCRAWAETFLNAESEKTANSSYDRSGVRYSELLRLPYFDPTRHLVIDPMHNIFLGLVKEHFQNILGYLPKGAKPKPKRHMPGSIVSINVTANNPLPGTVKEQKSVHRLISYMESPLDFDKTDKARFDATAKKWSSVHLTALIYVAKGLKCCPDTLKSDGYDSALPMSRRLKKTDLAVLLVEWVFNNSGLFSDIGGNLRNSRPFKLEEIQELWADIKNTVKPSWATSLPDNISSAGAKLKSDQWRSIATLFLPITLVRIWAGAPPESNGNVAQARLLHLTMLLCSAVNVMTSRSISQHNIDLYMDYMTQYRRELQDIFPSYVCHPNHHMALHIGEFMSMYGPVHGWWTFPLERMIGNLQRILTNYKSGEYEITIARSWTRSSNIRALFSRNTVPESIKFCSGMFKNLMATQNRNTLAQLYESELEEHQHEDDDDDENNENDSTKKQHMITLPQDIDYAVRKLFPDRKLPSATSTKARLTVGGFTYATSSVHEGNSGILCQGSDKPQCIIRILEFPQGHGVEKYWFAVRGYRPANVLRDPYAEYPHIRARLWSQELEDTIEVVPVSQVETHFAKCKITWEDQAVLVIISLSKTVFT